MKTLALVFGFVVLIFVAIILYKKRAPTTNGASYHSPATTTVYGEQPQKMVKSIRISQERGPLELASVRVFLGPRNIAPTLGSATQSSTKNNDEDKFGASRAISGTDAGAHFTHYARTDPQDSTPWWVVDFGAEYPISHILIHPPQRGTHPRPNSTLYPANVDQSKVEFLNGKQEVVLVGAIKEWRDNTTFVVNP